MLFFTILLYSSSELYLIFDANTCYCSVSVDLYEIKMRTKASFPTFFTKLSLTNLLGSHKCFGRDLMGRVYFTHYKPSTVKNTWQGYFMNIKITPRRKETWELHSILKDDLLIWAGAGWFGPGAGWFGARAGWFGARAGWFGARACWFGMYKIISALLSFC